MDDFEKEYFEKLKQIAPEYYSKRRDLAKSRIKMFAAALCRQLTQECEKFDLIVAAGNSGLFMAIITKMLYESLRVEVPQIITLPIYRFKSDENGKIGKLANIPKNVNILFVDDEIMSGLTVETALELILREFPGLCFLRCLIIAENHFFEWHSNIPKVSVNYFSYSRLIQGLNGNIGYFIPEDLYDQIASLVTGVESYNHAMAIVIGGALKRKNDQGIAFYDTHVEEICKQNIAGFEKIKTSLNNELRELINKGIEEYKSRKIKFRF